MYVFKQKQISNLSGEKTFNLDSDFDVNLFLPQRVVGVRDMLLYLLHEVDRNGAFAQQAKVVITEITNKN